MDGHHVDAEPLVVCRELIGIANQRALAGGLGDAEMERGAEDEVPGRGVGVAVAPERRRWQVRVHLYPSLFDDEPEEPRIRADRSRETGGRNRGTRWPRG